MNGKEQNWALAPVYDARVLGPGATEMPNDEGLRMRLEELEASGPVSLGQFLRGSSLPGLRALARLQEGEDIDTGVDEVVFASPQVAADEHPLQVVQVDGTHVRVVAGIVAASNANWTPTIGGTALTADPAPELTIGTTGWVYLQADIGTAVTGVTISFSATPPSDTTARSVINLAYVTFAGGKITGISQSVSGSLAFVFCGGNHFWEGV